MKKLLLLIMGLIVIIPTGVEAKEYDLNEFVRQYIYGGNDFNGEIELLVGDQLIAVSNIIVDAYIYDENNNQIDTIPIKLRDEELPDSRYIIKSYEEMTGREVPQNKNVEIRLRARLSSSSPSIFIVNYLLVDNPKEVIYHNTYDAINSNTTSYYEEETDILLNDISRDGYNFLGWYTSPTFEEDTRVTMITKDAPDVLNLYARWEKIEVTNPNTNSSTYIGIGILFIVILSTVLIIVYRIKKVSE